MAVIAHLKSNHILRNKRGNAWFEKRREEYCTLIREVFNGYRQVLGAEKIRTILAQRGQQVSKEYVAKLMCEMGLSSIRTTAKNDYLKLHEPEEKEYSPTAIPGRPAKSNLGQ